MKITFELKSDEYRMMEYLGAALKLYAQVNKEEEEEEEENGNDGINGNDEQEAETKPEAKPQAEVKPEPQREPQPVAEAEPEAKPEPQPEAEPEAKPDPQPEAEPKAEVKTMTPAEFRKEMQDLRDRLGIQSGTKLSSELAAYIRSICSLNYGESKPSQLEPEKLYNFVVTDLRNIVHDDATGFTVNAPF